jgi:signal transduction histidine kinase
MMNESSAHPDNPLAAKVREQTDLMRDQVTHHLERARLAARVAVIGTVTEVRPVVSALVRTMEKIHHARGISIDLDAPENARFRGEKQDLEEMIGNLVDNACKWAQSRVALETFVERPDVDSERRIVRIVVDDDGPGLSPQQREQVGRRGRRLDEAKPGTGLGLSIVVELASLYGGGLTLGTAPIGGLRAELVLPGA